ncbi:MAG: M20/M25/M40 family metallo-hydrolase [Gemmatimonadaceae bacterium]
MKKLAALLAALVLALGIVVIVRTMRFTPILAAARTVVTLAPVNDSLLAEHPPFSGDIADGFVWGHGTLDDKVGVLSTLEAVEALVAKGYQPKCTVYLAFGDDEEVEGHAIIRGNIAGVSRPAGLMRVTRMMERSPVTNASLRTTTAPTMIQGSPKENALPIRARALVNVRSIPGEAPESVLEHVKQVVDDTNVVVAMAGPGTPPSPVSSTASESYRILALDIPVLEPDAIVAPSLVVAATDSRQYSGYARDVYRFLPIQIGATDFERIHGTNERIGIHDYARGVAFMTLLISDLTSQ